MFSLLKLKIRVSVKRRLGVGVSFFSVLFCDLFANRFLFVEKLSVGIQRKFLLNKL